MYAIRLDFVAAFQTGLSGADVCGFFIAATLLSSPAVLMAEDRSCSSNPMVIAKSLVNHGRPSIYGGNPTVRIPEIDMQSVLGVSDGKVSKNAYTNIPQPIKATLNLETDLHGDFKVYPVHQINAGVMQLICVASVKDLVTKKASS